MSGRAVPAACSSGPGMGTTCATCIHLFTSWLLCHICRHPQPAADQVHGTGPDRGRRLPQANEPVAEPPPLKGREVHPYLWQLLDVLQARFSIIPLLHVVHVVLEPVGWMRAEG